jgi:16S rRNA (cytosine967-C5)-methyltransferase
MNKPNRKTAIGLAARQAASEIIWRVLYDATYVDEAFERCITEYRLDPRDRALVRAISATTLRRLGQIKAALADQMKKPLAPKFGHASCIMYTAAAQILFMKVPDHAAIDLAVRQIRQQRKLHHLSGMANAVLRKVMTNRDSVIAQDDGRLNTPKWLWQIWAKDYGKSVADQIAAAHLNEAPLDITLKSASHELTGDALPLGGLRLPHTSGKIEDLPGYDTGNWWVQDFAASLPVRLMGNVSHLSVADLCAAPGGKTMQLAAAGARVTAVDLSENRLARVAQNLARTGLEAEIICTDIATWQPPQKFDKILLDAPCSATGTIRRHPDALYLKKSSDIDNLVKLQRQLLANAATMLKPDGELIYCTCSLQKREGEGQIQAFLDANKNFRRKPFSPGELDGLGHLINDQGDIRTLPCSPLGDHTGMDGFFITRLKAKA